MSIADLDRHVGARLKLLRSARGMTQKNLAERIGVTFQQVQKYENGSNRISAGRLWQIRDVLDCEIKDFFDGLNNQSNQKSVDDLTGSIELASELGKIRDSEVRQRVIRLIRSLSDPAGSDSHRT